MKCALALARNEREARRVLLSRLPTLEHARLGGHTGGNLLLSMMERYSGDFLAAVDGLRALLGCAGRVWPVSVEQASLCAEYGDGIAHARRSRSRRRAGSRATRITRLWLEPDVQPAPGDGRGDPAFDAAIIGPGSFYTSLMPIFLVRGAAEAIRQVQGPVILVTNLLTEGRGMLAFTAADGGAPAERRDRPARSTSSSSTPPGRRDATLDALRPEHKAPLEFGDVPEAAKSSRENSGAARSRATTAVGWRRRSGRLSPVDCCDLAQDSRLMAQAGSGSMSHMSPNG